jgi:molecular chaperone HtpG
MADAVERFEMQANFQGLVQLLARNLYSSADAFVRELVQNAHDSIRLREQREQRVAGRIEIETRRIGTPRGLFEGRELPL